MTLSSAAGQSREPLSIPPAEGGVGILVLAAGMGSRFGGEVPKCLSPLRLGEGTLQRLLRQLAVLDAGVPVCVVTGHRAEAVAEAARMSHPGACSAINSAYGDGSLITSIRAGLAWLRGDRRLRGAWVLFGDAIYRPESLVRILTCAPTTLVVAGQPHASPHDHPIGMRFRPSDGRLLELGPDLAESDVVMAPAVYWPRFHWPALAAAAARGLALQWQALREEAARAPVVVLPLSPEQTWDVDRPEDLAISRRALLSPGCREYFRTNLSKEERNLKRHDHLADGSFHKICQSVTLAEMEQGVLQWLGRRQEDPPLVPAVLGRRECQLRLEHVDGIRLYELLRLLHAIALEGGQDASTSLAAGQTLLHRCLERLLRLQQDLLAWPQAADCTPYPLESHVVELLAVLVEVLGLPPLEASERHELEALQQQWEERDARLPFRDATPKNIIVAVPSLSPRAGADPGRRLQAVRSWLARGEAATVRILDVDFASVCHRTAPEDDLFSLLAHAASIPWGRRLLAQLIPEQPCWPRAVAQLTLRIHPDLVPDPARAARALLVRYLRFGGRKLLYRAVNPAGYAVRFRHDDPAPYFASLAGHIHRLDPGFALAHPLLSSRLRQLHKAVALLPPWHGQEAEYDFYREHGAQPVRYWQESPVESQSVPGERWAGA